jgi:outer membrane lipoprotein SlyB
MCNSVLFCDLRRPLTVEDYLQNSPIGALTDIVTGVGAGASVGASVGAGIGAGVGTLTNTVAGTLAVAVTAQPGPQT